MRYISSREFRINPSVIWELLEQGEDVVITSHGKPLGLLMGTGDADLQALSIELSRLRARLAVTAMRQAAQKKGLDRLDSLDVDGIVRKARKAAKPKPKSKKAPTTNA